MASDVTVTTALMGMVLPVVGQSPGPLYAQDLNAALQNVVDTHTHVPGSGAQIPPAALNVNADLPFASAGVSYRITSLKATAYTDQGGALSASFTGHVYNSGGDLWWNNGSGTAVRITAGNALNAASIRGIGGDYGTDPNANAIYTTSIKTFTWTQAAGVAAKMAVGDLLIYDTAGGANAVTVKNPGALAGAYSLTLPAALPANANNSNLVALSTAGVLSTTQTPQFADPRVQDGSGSYYFALKGSASSLGASHSLILPVVTGDDTLVLLALAQTLTNKTLTAPVLGGTVSGTYTLAGTPTLSGGILAGPGAFAVGATFSGQLQIASGSAATPAYSGSVDPTTGVYFAATSVLNVSLAGTLRASFNPATGNGSALLYLSAPSGVTSLGWNSAGQGTYPAAAVNTGGALGCSFENVGEVNYWNTRTSAAALSHAWLQLTGATTATLLMALDVNSNLLLGGLTGAVTGMVDGLQLGSAAGTAAPPGAAPASGSVAVVVGSQALALYNNTGGGTHGLFAELGKSATDAFGVASQSIHNLYTTAGGIFQIAGNAAKTVAAIGLDLTASYSSSTGTPCAGVGSAGSFTTTLRQSSLNANLRGLRIVGRAIGNGVATGFSLTVAGLTILNGVSVSALAQFDITITYLTATTVNVTGSYNLANVFTGVSVTGGGTNNLTSGGDQTVSFTQSANAGAQIKVLDCIVYQIG